MNNFLKRILIFHFPLAFAYFKYSNYLLNAVDFQKRVIYLLRISGLSNEVITTYSSKIISIFPFFLLACALFSIFAILNMKIFQLLSGFITFYIGLIFVNPYVTINKQLRIYPNYWKSYIPSFEFIIIIVAAIGMICSAFVVHEKDYEKKEKID